MKKLIYCALALAAGLFASSCQQENLEPVQEGNTVTFTVEIPEVATKADVVDDGTNINNLVYAVYRTDGRDLTEAAASIDPTKLVYRINPKAQDGGTTFVKGKTNVTLELINNQKYIVLFWAQVGQTWVAGTEFDLTNIVYPSKLEANQSKYSAFCGAAFVEVTGASRQSVQLTRPFAQMNLASTDPANYDVDIVSSSVKIENAYPTFNVATKKASGEFRTVEYTTSENPDGNFGDYYHYVAMNYIFANSKEDGTSPVKVTCTINTAKHGEGIVKEISNVPVAQNYKTNIVGNLLTSDVKYNVELVDDWGDEGKDMEVITDGIIKNIDGAYEVTNANGLAYMLNNIFVENTPLVDGGEFYLTDLEYDMTDFEVISQNVPEGKTLKVYGKAHVVTRAAGEGEAVAVTIIGLKSAMIKTNNGTVSFSGIKVEVDGTDENGETPAFIETNNGTADFTSCETDEQSFVGTNEGIVTEKDSSIPSDTPIVSEDNGTSLTKVSTADELVAALKAKKDVFFVEDITIAATDGGYSKAGILQNNAQTIDGNGHTLTVTGAGATWDCAIYTNGGTIKNLTVAGAMRGIFTAGQNSDLYIDSVKFDKVVYTFNSDDGNKQYGVYVSNSTVNGWTSFSNVHKDVVFTNCSFGSGSGYAFCRPYNTCSFVNCAFSEDYEIDTRAASTFENCTLNGVPVTSENIATLVVDNIQNAKLPGVDGTFVSTGAQLLEALNNDNATVILANDITMAAEQNSGYGKAGIVIEPGKTINGNGKTLKVTDAGGTWDCAIYAKGGTIKNLTVAQGFRGIFMGTASGDVFIENVTFDGPTYTFNSDGGNKNYGVYLSNCTIKGWTSHSDVHKEVVYTNCTFGERGYKFCRPYGPTTFVNCNFCEGYEIDAIGKVKFENCTLNGVAVTAENYTQLVTGNANNVSWPVAVETVDALNAALRAGNDQTIVIAGNISDATIELPTTLENVTLKGTEGCTLKNVTISAADGNSYNYKNLTFDGLTFDNGGILLTGWRNGDEVIENLTITNCTFKNLDNTSNTAPVHINKDASEAVKNFTFTNNVINGATGGSKSGVYAQVTGNIVFTDNVINNVSFRPYVIQITTDDGVADKFVVTGNTFSGSSKGRAQGLGNNAEGTDNVELVVSENIFKGITEAQQICYWSFNAETTTADLSHNYYDIDIAANPSRIYYNSAASSVADLVEMGVYPIYTELNADGTINTDSLAEAPTQE